MRPTIALISLLALLALGGILFLTLGRDSATRSLDAPEAIHNSEVPASGGTQVVQVPDAAVASGAVVGAQRTEIKAQPTAAPAARSASTAVLAGRLVDAAGQPVAGADVRASPGDFEMFDYEPEATELASKDKFRARSGSDGRFEIPGIKPGTARLSARAAGFVPLSKRAIGVPALERLDLGDLPMEQSVVLEGRVVDSRGAGVAGARLMRASGDGVVFFSASGDAEGGPPPLATSGPDGSFRIDQLASGPWRLRIASEAHPDKLENGLSKRSGEIIRGLEFALEDGFEIAGRVQGVPAAALGQASVAASPPGAAGGEMIFLEAGEEEAGASGTAGPNRRSAKLEPDGSFVVRGLREGSYTMQARVRDSKEAFFWPRSASERVDAKTGDRAVQIAWQLSSSVTFQALDARTRQPIESLAVECSAGSSAAMFDPRGVKPRKYPGGMVSIDDLRPRSDSDRASLTVRATGFETLVMKGIILTRGGIVDLGVLELQRTATVEVHVVDNNTRGPLEKARVELREVREGGGAGEFAMSAVSIDVRDGGDPDVTFGPGEPRTARTDEQGIARINSLAGKRGELVVTLDGYAPHTSEPFDMPVGSDVRQTIVLDQGGSIAITLLDSNGVPVSGARIDHRPPGAEADPFGGAMGRKKGAATDSKGTVTLTNLAVGLHRFRPAKSEGEMEGGMVFAMDGEDGGAEGWSEAEIVRGTTAELVLREAPRATVKGRVSEGGVVLAGASLSISKRGGDSRFGDMEMPFAQGPRTKTDGDGRYKFERIETGSYDLVVRHATRSMPARYPIEVDASGLEFDIDLLVSVLEGRVLDAEHKPMVGAKVWAERKPNDGGGESREMRIMSIAGGDMSGGDGEAMVFDSSNALSQSSVISDKDGRFSLRGVQSDIDLVVKVTAKDCQPKSSDPVSVAAGQTRSGIEVTVDPAGRIKVKVVGLNGAKPGPCLVRARPAEGAGREDEKTEFAQGGSATFTGLRPGKWQLRASPLGGFGGQDEPEDDSLWQEVLVVAHEVAQAELPLN